MVALVVVPSLPRVGGGGPAGAARQRVGKTTGIAAVLCEASRVAPVRPQVPTAGPLRRVITTPTVHPIAE